MSAPEEIKTTIPELSAFDFPDTLSKPDGYDSKTVPEATSENMGVMMNQINKLSAQVNRLDGILMEMISALKR